MSWLDIVIPPGCVSCKQRGALLCSTCRSRVRVASDSRDRFAIPDAGIVIGDAFEFAAAACAYEGPLRSALAALKYKGVRRLAPLVAELTAPAVGCVLTVLDSAILVPVPVHRERQRARGYNQAELIARALGRTHGLAVAELLGRRRSTEKQHRLNRAARLANLRGAFQAIAPVPADCILVDDIITTSATLEACALALRAAGATAVYGVAVAREV
ncbi:MAG TPA: ComF family protein [Candidatus Limnocylindria bacterium]|nr:ComF family protein [Candidatus Limnocylindria bacterium]